MIFAKVYLKTERSASIQSSPVWSTKLYYNLRKFDKNCIIGNNVNFQHGVYLPQNTKVGDNCFFSIQVGVLDEKYPTVGKQVRKPVTIGNNVVLGAGVKLMGGITVGDNSVIGMDSTVLKDVPADLVVAGTPATVISNRKDFDEKKKKWENS